MSIIVIEGSNGTGKSTVIKKIKQIYNITDKKSVPDWFREYIDFARKCPLEIQKEIYKIGHDANYFECNKNEDYIFDRFYYSTVIRINYGLGISIEDTVKEILSFKNIPDILFLLQANVESVERRLNDRDNFIFDKDFYDYENKVYELLLNKCDIMYIIDNSEDIDSAVYKICDIIDNKTIIRKR